MLHDFFQSASRSFFNNIFIFTEITVDFTGIRTWNVSAQGEHADH